LSPSPEQVEYAEVLLRRANGDLYVCSALSDDAEVDDGVLGFHAQQAVEKALKVALVLADVELPRTHDLEFIAKLVRDAALDLPASCPVAMPSGVQTGCNCQKKRGLLTSGRGRNP